MERLPSELLCYILSKLDGHSLACAAKVCQRWHGIVNILGKAFNVWFKHCLLELGLDDVVYQTGLTHLLTTTGRTAAEARREDWEFWQELYAANKRCNCIGSEKWGPVAERVKKCDEVVTALVLNPPTSTSYGTLWMALKDGNFHGGTLDRRSWFSHFQSRRVCPGHINGCTDMTVVTLDGCPGYGTSSTEPVSFVVSTGIQGVVKVTDFQGHQKAVIEPRSHQAYCVSSVGPYFVVGHDACITQGLVIYKIVRAAKMAGGSSNSVSVLPLMKLSGLRNSAVMSVMLSHKQVVAGDDHGILYSWDIPSLSSFEGMSPKSGQIVEIDKPSAAVQLKTMVEQVLLHRNQVIALSAMGHGIIFVLNNDDWSTMSVICEEKINALAGIGGYIKCFAASGSVLAVGRRTGVILLFRISSKNWPSNLKQNFIGCLSTNMMDLTTLTFSDDGREKVLVAAGSAVFAFQWRRKEEQMLTKKTSAVKTVRGRP
ncbi:uncharacterized protein [Littorina saxatilis]|uniref:F-box domain-containing protein n=1 Tax=Littorina saxatilis TaxID=31220 RepID=A0AAN9G6G4_9CAEN